MCWDRDYALVLPSTTLTRDYINLFPKVLKPCGSFNAAKIVFYEKGTFTSEANYGGTTEKVRRIWGGLEHNGVSMWPMNGAKEKDSEEDSGGENLGYGFLAIHTSSKNLPHALSGCSKSGIYAASGKQSRASSRQKVGTWRM
ncbi:hypothetical protein SCP_1701540 [Sparassis crispa]|uniref:Uncharacterized protein n=1 Tax=Sparassis crispa TaxID=139825 RepID=A0A401H620_9APHY|nr:hypothetical protein SCP_1701540 [Sparassis crispa]GBE89829.1 hypothetical protein SCP_1701540 [Sparassis crispa]